MAFAFLHPLINPPVSVAGIDITSRAVEGTEAELDLLAAAGVVSRNGCDFVVTPSGMTDLEVYDPFWPPRDPTDRMDVLGWPKWINYAYGMKPIGAEPRFETNRPLDATVTWWLGTSWPYVRGSSAGKFAMHAEPGEWYYFRADMYIDAPTVAQVDSINLNTNFYGDPEDGDSWLGHMNGDPSNEPFELVAGHQRLECWRQAIAASDGIDFYVNLVNSTGSTYTPTAVIHKPVVAWASADNVVPRIL